MFRAFVFIALSFFVTLFFGCKDKSTEPINEKSKSLFPLAVGNTWKYKLSSQSSDSLGIVVWTITKRISVEGKEYFLISTSGLGSSYFASQNEKDGFSLSMYDSIDGLTSPFFFKYPAVNNETYQYQIPKTDSILNIKVVTQNIQIDNHLYSCFGYINQNLNPSFPFMYFSENVGLIRYKLVYNSGNGIDTTHYFIYDLQSRTLNN